jgi:dsDNA-specific endonuclease/ATPase MutS2
VAALSAGIQDFTGFLRSFHNKILPDGTLDDRASPELSRIRREIEKQKRQIQESLRGYLRKLAEGGAVQDELITIRGERFRDPGESRAETARAGRGARRQFQRTDRVCRAAGNHRAEQ